MNIALYWFAFVGLVILVGLCLGLSQRRTPLSPQGGSWGRGTRYFLVTLRLAIGWHILGEGLEKFTSSTWSSEAYLREATGPLAPTFRDLAGDGLLARLTPGPGNSFPEALGNDWQAYFNNFKHYYHLDEQQAKVNAYETTYYVKALLQNRPLAAVSSLSYFLTLPQAARAQIIFDHAKTTTSNWLLTGTKSVKLISPYPPPLEVEKTVAARIKEYQGYEQQARTIEEKDLPMYGSVVYGKLLDAKKDANSIRASLKADLAKQTADMRRDLRKVLTPEQENMPLPPDSVQWPVREWGQLAWSDALVTYGLLAVGGCLLLGFLTRTACLVGAAFLLMFYLAMPPLPDWPASPKLEGHYLYINKTFIEMLALLTLATTRSGRWLGLDALVQFLRPGALSPSNPSKETPHGP